MVCLCYSFLNLVSFTRLACAESILNSWDLSKSTARTPYISTYCNAVFQMWATVICDKCSPLGSRRFKWLGVMATVPLKGATGAKKGLIEFFFFFFFFWHITYHHTQRPELPNLAGQVGCTIVHWVKHFCCFTHITTKCLLSVRWYSRHWPARLGNSGLWVWW